MSKFDTLHYDNIKYSFIKPFGMDEITENDFDEVKNKLDMINDSLDDYYIQATVVFSKAGDNIYPDATFHHNKKF